ncbi:N-formylglutamate amidohydrolase [Actinoplanes sp. CA-054009]
MTVDEEPVLRPAQGRGGHRPLHMDIPHAGRVYPPDLHPACPERSLVLTEDRYADIFYSPLKQVAARWIEAPYARSYMNVNGDRAHGHAVVRYRTLQGELLQQPLDAARLQDRIRRVYDPYHALLDEHTQAGLGHFGQLLHLNLHSFPSVDWRTAGLPPMPFEIDIGDRHGASSPRGFSEHIVRALRLQGFTVGYNEAFAGGQIVRRLHRDHQGVDVIQIEVRRDLYLRDDLYIDEQRLRRSRTAFLRGLLGALAHVDPRLR